MKIQLTVEHFYQWMGYAGEDFMDQNESMINEWFFIQWMRAGTKITDDGNFDVTPVIKRAIKMLDDEFTAKVDGNNYSTMPNTVVPGHSDIMYALNDAYKEIYHLKDNTENGDHLYYMIAAELCNSNIQHYYRVLRELGAFHGEDESNKDIIIAYIDLYNEFFEDFGLHFTESNIFEILGQIDYKLGSESNLTDFEDVYSIWSRKVWKYYEDRYKHRKIKFNSFK